MTEWIDLDDVDGFEDVTAMRIVRRSGEEAFCLIDTEDVDRVVTISKHWQLLSSKDRYVRCVTEVGGVKKTVLLHRFIMDAKDGDIVDHIDKDPMNCCKSNLRITGSVGNGGNRSTLGKVVGVRALSSGNFSAHIMHNGISIDLGHYATKEEACRAYNIASRNLRGDVHTFHDVPDPYGEENTPVRVIPRAGRSKLKEDSYFIKPMIGKKRTTYAATVRRHLTQETIRLGTFWAEQDAMDAIERDKMKISEK